MSNSATLEIKPIHEVLNKSQLKALASVADFQTYIAGAFGSTVVARNGSRNMNYVLANKENGADFKMELSISPRGMRFNHAIYKKTSIENGVTCWKLVKTWSIDKV